MCDALSVEFGISLRAFYFLNPQIDAKCGNLWLETSYCVKPVGDMTQYPGFLTSNFITLAPATYTTTTSSAALTLAFTLTVSIQLPLASGTVQECYKYRNYISIPAIVDQSLSAKAPSVNPSINSCQFVKTRYGIDIGDLLEWNPTLNADLSQCYLQEGFSYCVLKDEDSENCTCKSFDLYTDYFNMGRDSVLAVKVSFIG